MPGAHERPALPEPVTRLGLLEWAINRLTADLVLAEAHSQNVRQWAQERRPNVLAADVEGAEQHTVLLQERLALAVEWATQLAAHSPPPPPRRRPAAKPVYRQASLFPEE